MKNMAVSGYMFFISSKGCQMNPAEIIPVCSLQKSLLQYSYSCCTMWNSYLPRKTYPSDPDFAPRSKNAQNSSKYRKPPNCQITSRNRIYVTRQTEQWWSEVLTPAGCWVTVCCTLFSMSQWQTPPFFATDAHQTTMKPSNNPPKY